MGWPPSRWRLAILATSYLNLGGIKSGIKILQKLLRSGEARGAKWEEIELAVNRWITPSNRKKERRSALKIRSVFSDGDYVFGGKPLFDTAVSKKLKRYAGNYTVHGLRSSFRQWAAETTQYPEHVLEKALGHSSRSRLIDAYKKSDLFQQRRGVMQDWANYCLGEQGLVPRLPAN